VPASGQPAAPKESATVILVHIHPVNAWNVFLARRHSRSSFMADAYVFPGGQIAEADRDKGLQDFLSMPARFDPRALLQDDSLSRETAQSLFFCAIRETFEETGVLLARTQDGSPLQLNSKEENARFAVHRRELNAGRTTLGEMARQENLLFPLDTLVPYAHWITPEFLPKRFSTRFFLAALPENQSAATDQGELTDSLWAMPEEVLRRYRDREIVLMPPTLKTLEELARYACLDDLFAGARSRDIYPILPEPGEKMIKLPHDPEYGIERCKRPARSGEPSRIIMNDGIWQTGFCLNHA
jgi:8-oxo-dGTP pyrophosphatase MutT (NUDIX family)